MASGKRVSLANLNSIGKLLLPLEHFKRERASVRPRYGPIGFEISHEKLHMVQIETQSEKMGVRAAASLPFSGGRSALLGDAERLGQMVKRVLREHPFVGRRVVSPVPSDYLKLAMVSYTVEDPAQESRILLASALERVGGNADEWVVDYLPIRPSSASEQQRVALVAMIKRDDQHWFTACLEKTGVEVEALEIGPVAMRRLVASQPATSNFPNVLVINFARTSSYLTVFSGDRLLMDRGVSFNEQDAARSVAQSLEVSEDEAIELLYRYGVSRESEREVSMVGNGDFEVGDISIGHTIRDILNPQLMDLQADVRKALIYVASQFRGASVDRVYLLGSAARWPGTQALFSSLLNLDTEVLNAFKGFDVVPGASAMERLDPIAGVATATGCALRGLLKG